VIWSTSWRIRKDRLAKSLKDGLCGPRVFVPRILVVRVCAPRLGLGLSKSCEMYK
jgi:hypothetical protein